MASLITSRDASLAFVSASTTLSGGTTPISSYDTAYQPLALTNILPALFGDPAGGEGAKPGAGKFGLPEDGRGQAGLALVGKPGNFVRACASPVAWDVWSPHSRWVMHQSSMARLQSAWGPLEDALPFGEPEGLLFSRTLPRSISVFGQHVKHNLHLLPWSCLLLSRSVDYHPFHSWSTA